MSTEQKQTADESRAVFEQSMTDGYDFKRDGDGDYVAPDTFEAYNGWQARGEHEAVAGLQRNQDIFDIGVAHAASRAAQPDKAEVVAELRDGQIEWNGLTPVGRIEHLADFVKRSYPAGTPDTADLRFNGWMTIANAKLLYLSALPPTRDESGLVKELADLRAELRHFKGRPAVDGKPLELQTRDELLAVVHGLLAENDRLGFEANAGRQAEAEADDEARELAKALEALLRQSGSVFSGKMKQEARIRAETVIAKHTAQAKAGA